MATTSSRGALEAGAVAALVERSRAPSLSGNLIAVDDPLKALAALATFWRSRFDIPVAVVTGSNGKTTTKEMIAAIFRAAVGRCRRCRDAGQLQQCDRPAARAARVAIGRIGSPCSRSA